MSAHEFRDAVRKRINDQINGNPSAGIDYGLIDKIVGRAGQLDIERYRYFTGEMSGLEHALTFMDQVFAEMHSTENVDPFTEK